MSVEIGDRVVATAWFSEHAAADGNGAWIVSTHPARLSTRDQAITALTVAALGESGYPDSHPLVVALGRSCGDRPTYQTHDGAVAVLVGVAAVKHGQSGAD